MAACSVGMPPLTRAQKRRVCICACMCVMMLPFSAGFSLSAPASLGRVPRHCRVSTVVMAKRGNGKGERKGFGAPPSTTKAAPQAKAAKPAPSAAPAQSPAAATTVHPALLALIAETSQRRAAREEAFASRAQELKSVLETETYAVIDGLLGETMCSAMRAEAVALLGETALTEQIISTDTRAASVIIEPELFMQAPLCTEYVLDCAKTLAPLLSGRFGPLSDDASCNMLACYGVDGGNFPVHIDNHGNRDRRVLTLIYYMNPNYDAGRQVHPRPTLPAGTNPCFRRAVARAHVTAVLRLTQGGCFVPWRITDRAPPKDEPPVMLSPGVYMHACLDLPLF